MKTVVLAAVALLSAAAALSQTPRLLVSGIQAKPTAEGEVVVSWQLPQLDQDLDAGQLSLLLYRTTRQKAGSGSLDGETPLATLPYGASSYTDLPEGGGIYYYTVIISGADSPQHPLVIPDRNSTVVGVGVASESQQALGLQREILREGPSSATGLRSTPLPYLRLPSGQSEDVPVNPERRQSSSAIALMEDRERTIPLPPHHIFRQEREEGRVGEDSILQDIVNSHLSAGDYQAAELRLREFLGINRSEDATDRGTFYLGEVLLYQGKSRQALSCFLRVQDRFPDLAARWIRAALDAYQLPVIE